MSIRTEHQELMVKLGQAKETATKKIMDCTKDIFQEFEADTGLVITGIDFELLRHYSGLSADTMFITDVKLTTDIE